MPEQLRVGVIGASWYSDLRYLPALKRHPRAQTVAICDIAKVNAHLSTLLDRPEADGGGLDPTNDSVMLAIEFANGASD